MKRLNSGISQEVAATGETSAPVITPERFEALRQLILYSRLICDRNPPELDELKILIVSWHQALAKIPSEKLKASLQCFIENRDGRASWITALDVLAGFRMLREDRVPPYRRIEAPFTTPPPEYYDELAKLGFFPRESLQSKRANGSAPAHFTRKYAIVYRAYPCKICTKKAYPVVFYKTDRFCLDCAKTIAEIFPVNSDNSHHNTGE